MATPAPIVPHPARQAAGGISDRANLSAWATEASAATGAGGQSIASREVKMGAYWASSRAVCITDIDARLTHHWTDTFRARRNAASANATAAIKGGKENHADSEAVAASVAHALRRRAGRRVRYGILNRYWDDAVPSSPRPESWGADVACALRRGVADRIHAELRALAGLWSGELPPFHTADNKENIDVNADTNVAAGASTTHKSSDDAPLRYLNDALSYPPGYPSAATAKATENGPSFDARRRAALYANTRAACESGWDFSSRWFPAAPLRPAPPLDAPSPDTLATEVAAAKSDLEKIGTNATLADLETSSVLPVDLNCLLYATELAYAALAETASTQFHVLTLEMDVLAAFLDAGSTFTRLVADTEKVIDRAGVVAAAAAVHALHARLDSAGATFAAANSSNASANSSAQASAPPTKGEHRRSPGALDADPRDALIDGAAEARRAAAARARLINTYMWDPLLGYYFDFDLRTRRRRTHVWTLAGAFPLFTRVASPAQAQRVTGVLFERFLHRGGFAATWTPPSGLVARLRCEQRARMRTEAEAFARAAAGVAPQYSRRASTENANMDSVENSVAPSTVSTVAAASELQWEAPNGWPPLAWVATAGLAQYTDAARAANAALRRLRARPAASPVPPPAPGRGAELLAALRRCGEGAPATAAAVEAVLNMTPRTGAENLELVLTRRVRGATQVLMTKSGAEGLLRPLAVTPALLSDVHALQAAAANDSALSVATSDASIDNCDVDTSQWSSTEKVMFDAVGPPLRVPFARPASVAAPYTAGMRFHAHSQKDNQNHRAIASALSMPTTARATIEDAGLTANASVLAFLPEGFLDIASAHFRADNDEDSDVDDDILLAAARLHDLFAPPCAAHATPLLLPGDGRAPLVAARTLPWDAHDAGLIHATTAVDLRSATTTEFGAALWRYREATRSRRRARVAKAFDRARQQLPLINDEAHNSRDMPSDVVSVSTLSSLDLDPTGVGLRREPAWVTVAAASLVGTIAARVHTRRVAVAPSEKSQHYIAAVPTVTIPHSNPLQPPPYPPTRALLSAQIVDLAARRYLFHAKLFFLARGVMPEKYDVRAPTAAAGGGEYTCQAGFGWTNGVWLALCRFAKNACRFHTPLRKQPQLHIDTSPARAVSPTPKKGLRPSESGGGLSSQSQSDASDTDSLFAMTPRPPSARALAGPRKPRRRALSTSDTKPPSMGISTRANGNLDEDDESEDLEIERSARARAASVSDSAACATATQLERAEHRMRSAAGLAPAPTSAGTTSSTVAVSESSKLARFSSVALAPPVFQHSLAHVFTFPTVATGTSQTATATSAVAVPNQRVLYTVTEDAPDTVAAAGCALVTTETATLAGTALPTRLQLRELLRKGPLGVAATTAGPVEGSDSEHSTRSRDSSDSLESADMDFAAAALLEPDSAAPVTLKPAPHTPRRRPPRVPEAANVAVYRVSSAALPCGTCSTSPQSVAAAETSSAIASGTASEAEAGELARVLTYTKSALPRDAGAQSYCLPEVFFFTSRHRVASAGAPPRGRCGCAVPNPGQWASLGPAPGEQELSHDSSCTARRSLAFLSARGSGEYHAGANAASGTAAATSTAAAAARTVTGDSTPKRTHTDMEEHATAVCAAVTARAAAVAEDIAAAAAAAETITSICGAESSAPKNRP